jgi:hypothetical protein
MEQYKSACSSQRAPEMVIEMLAFNLRHIYLHLYLRQVADRDRISKARRRHEPEAIRANEACCS